MTFAVAPARRVSRTAWRPASCPHAPPAGAPRPSGCCRGSRVRSGSGYGVARPAARTLRARSERSSGRSVEMKERNGRGVRAKHERPFRRCCFYRRSGFFAYDLVSSPPPCRPPRSPLARPPARGGTGFERPRRRALTASRDDRTRRLAGSRSPLHLPALRADVEPRRLSAPATRAATSRQSSLSTCSRHAP